MLPNARPDPTPSRSERVHTLVLGAGPAGLTVGYQLARGGVLPVIVERESGAGGLMRAVRRGPFTVDLGRKELSTRIPEVDHLWSDLLGDAFRPYVRRVGVLYKGRILETDSSFRGHRRGMPPQMLVTAAADLLRCWWRLGPTRPQDYEQYWHRRCGAYLSGVLAQGYWEKFRGVRWKDMPVPGTMPSRSTRTAAMRSGLALSRGGPDTMARHPIQGSGQICEVLEERIEALGGRFHFGTVVSNMEVVAGRVDTVTVERDRSQVVYEPAHVVSSLPVELLARFLASGGSGTSGTKLPSHAGERPRTARSALLVYLFLAEPPRFPHAWLEVTCPHTRAGRITNYAAFGGNMVPPGKTCLCVEFFCGSDSSLLRLSDEQVFELALLECGRSMLVRPDHLVDHLVLRLPGADAATSWRDWTESKRRLVSEITEIENLYSVNWPGTDKATYAGMEAANAILTGDRSTFDPLSPATAYVAPVR